MMTDLRETFGGGIVQRTTGMRSENRVLGDIGIPNDVSTPGRGSHARYPNHARHRSLFAKTTA